MENDIAHDIAKIKSIIRGYENNNFLKQFPVSDKEKSLNFNSSESENNHVSFMNIFNNAINKVNEMSVKSAEAKEQYQLGNPEVSLVDVMLVTQKASLAFEAVKQVRNKIIDAYKEIMNMSV